MYQPHGLFCQEQLDYDHDCGRFGDIAASNAGGLGGDSSDIKGDIMIEPNAVHLRFNTLIPLTRKGWAFPRQFKSSDKGFTPEPGENARIAGGEEYGDEIVDSEAAGVAGGDVAADAAGFARRR